METFYVLVTGPFSSGKTEFIRGISETEVYSTERWVKTPVINPKENTTPALDFGRLTLDDDNAIYLFGTPGAFRFIVDRYLKGFERNFSVVLMVDSSKPETFREASSLLHNEIIPSQLPCVVAANRQDHPDAWHVDMLRVVLQLPPDVPILPCVAKKRNTLKPVLLALFELWSTWGDDGPADAKLAW